MLSKSRKTAPSTAEISGPIPVDFACEALRTTPAWSNVSKTMLNEDSNVGPIAMATFRSALKQRRLRVDNVGLDAGSYDARLDLSFPDTCVAKLSTLSKPLPLEYTPEVSVVGDETADMLDVTILGGTAAFPSVVKKASRAVDNLRRPETWTNL